MISSSNLRKAKIIRAYQGGMAPKEISTRYGVSVNSVNWIVKDVTPPRDLRSASRKRAIRIAMLTEKQKRLCQEIRLGWSKGATTYEIAMATGERESTIYNLLDIARSMRHG